MERSEALAKFTENAVEVLAVEPSQVTLEASFADDLGADSLDLVEAGLELEALIGRDLPECALAEARTVGDLARCFGTEVGQAERVAA